MRIYNTQTHRKEEFIPREEGKVAMYICGPTVYNYIHIGNARTFLSFDAIRRYLTWRGYEVNFVSNITDVDDKIIARAAREGTTAEAIAEKYTSAFLDTMHAMNIEDPTVRPRATQEIPAMIQLVLTLIDKGHAYERQGSVYFSVRSFPEYGALSGRDVDELVSGGRDQRGGNFEDDKDDPLDFALWKAAKPGEPAWDSPWGKGRPGWHIECSVMSAKYLGLPLDIHGGGSDLVFPHHENEMAQSEAAYGVEFSRYWMHGGMLLIDSEKMSKSLGNFLLARDVVENNDPNAVRLLMLQTHYRSPLDYSADRLKEAASSYGRLVTAVRNLRWAAERGFNGGGVREDTADSDVLRSSCLNARARFMESMDDDFNTAGALGAVFALVGEANAALAAEEGTPGMVLPATLEEAASCIEEFLGVLGILISKQDGADPWPVEVVDLATRLCGFTGDDAHAAVDALLATRAQARSERDWGLADGVRDGLSALGFTIEDTPAGARVIYQPLES